jgi:iron complex outermembrane receptor protein
VSAPSFLTRTTLVALALAAAEARADEPPIVMPPADTAPADSEPAEELLDLSLEQLLEVEVTSATKSAMSLRRAPAVIAVVTSAQIRERGYQSVGEALESLPGLDLLHDHYQYNLGVRGVSPGARAWSRTVKVMIDGQPVSFRPSQEAWLGDELIPIAAVERIEVIKGPASVLYGANAYLGVVNVITKDGEAARAGEVSVRHGFGARLSDPGASALAGGARGRFDAVAAVGGSSPALTGDAPVPVPGQMSPLAAERSRSGHPVTASGFAKLGVQTGERSRLTLDVSYQQLDRFTEFMDWGLEAHDNRQALYNVYARARFATTFKDAFDWRVGAAVSNGAPLARDRLNVASGLTTHVERDVGYRGLDVFTDLSWRLRELARVSVGADYTLDDQHLLAYSTVAADGTSTVNPPTATVSGRRDFSNLGAYVHGLWSPLAESRAERWRALTFVGGLRYDHQNIYGDNVNYSAGVVHQLGANLYTKLLYGTSFLAPSSNQLYSNFIDTGGVIGNPLLKPERARTTELTFGGAFGPYVTAEATGFYTLIESKVELRPQQGAPTNNPTPQNLAEIRTAGLEASVAFSRAAFSSYANYSYEHGTSTQSNRFSTVPGATVTTDTLLYPSQMLKLGALYRVAPAHLQASVEGRWIGQRLDSESNNEIVNGILGVATQRYALPSYFLLNLYVSTYQLAPWKGHETSVGAKVTNVLGTSYAFPGYVGFDIPGFARSFYVTLSQRF